MRGASMDSQDIYQEYIIELYKNPLNFGAIVNADYSAEAFNPTCGDRIVLYLKVSNEKVTEARHSGEGCAISQASASLLTQSMKGKTLEELKALTKDDALRLLKIDLSKNPTRIRCALLPLDALRKAVMPRELATV